MENYLPLLQKSPLFASMEPQQITSVLHCVGAVVREAGAGEYILRAGDRTQAMGLLLSGSAFAVQDDLWGQRNIMGKILPPGTFAEPFAATPGAVLNVSVVASVPSKVMFLNIQRITTVCSETCPQHALLIRNLVSVQTRRRGHACAGQPPRAGLRHFHADHALAVRRLPVSNFREAVSLPEIFSYGSLDAAFSARSFAAFSLLCFAISIICSYI